MATPKSVDAYLPTKDLTLKKLLQGYGAYWTQQPSLSGYPRYYSVNEKDFTVWEGYPGSYDSYGDFADDDRFYNEVVKAYQLFWHLSQNRDGSVRVWGLDQGKMDALPPDEQTKAFVGAFSGRDLYKIRFENTYPTLADLRQGMITHWATLKPSLGEQGQRWHQLIAQSLPDITARLQELGSVWTREKSGDSRQSLAYTSENYAFLVRWFGDAEAVKIPPPYSPTYRGHPIINQEQLVNRSSQDVVRFNIFRVRVRRLPVGFSLEESTIITPDRYREIGDVMKTIEELTAALEASLPRFES
jgi:hypothetical protein